MTNPSLSNVIKPLSNNLSISADNRKPLWGSSRSVLVQCAHGLMWDATRRSGCFTPVTGQR